MYVTSIILLECLYNEVRSVKHNLKYLEQYAVTTARFLVTPNCGDKLLVVVKSATKLLNMLSCKMELFLKSQ